MKTMTPITNILGTGQVVPYIEQMKIVLDRSKFQSLADYMEHVETLGKIHSIYYLKDFKDRLVRPDKPEIGNYLVGLYIENEIRFEKALEAWENWECIFKGLEFTTKDNSLYVNGVYFNNWNLLNLNTLDWLIQELNLHVFDFQWNEKHLI